jgi:hypothetical protein
MKTKIETKSYLSLTPRNSRFRTSKLFVGDTVIVAKFSGPQYKIKDSAKGYIKDIDSDSNCFFVYIIERLEGNWSETDLLKVNVDSIVAFNESSNPPEIYFE